MNEEIPYGMSELEISMHVVDSLVQELSAVLQKYKGHPKLSAYMVLGALESLTLDYHRKMRP